MKNQKNFTQEAKISLLCPPARRDAWIKSLRHGLSAPPQRKKSREDFAAVPGENLIFSGGFLG
jgi:hypothetical protein